MHDIIHLLSDSVANQIAAGEVIQRPASAVKELLENAVDANATSIQLIVKDAGKTLVQVVDNGKGMSFNDARMCFERHATSKLSTADDLFKITTKGFRGEALASIAAIAHVELKTKMADEETGTLLLIEGSTVTDHSPIATQDGTSVSIKNLFFNVPARRNFLKSDTIELGHIEEEFFRVALIHTAIAFSFYHNGKLLWQLQPSNFRLRIINLFGNQFKEKLYPIEQKTDFMTITGFIAKPECAKKKKREQYMFINNRYVRHNLLNYAVETAYSELIPQECKPAYFIHLIVNPSTIDINISPTKVDVKLQDERLVFGFLNSTVKKSLGVLSLTPRLDFDYEAGLDVSNLPKNQTITPPTITIHPDYNPFTNPNPNKSSASYAGNHEFRQSDLTGWTDFMQNLKTENTNPTDSTTQTTLIDKDFFENDCENGKPLSPDHVFVIDNQYIIYKNNLCLEIVHIQNARERILYDKYLDALENKAISVQQSLFPETISLSASNADLANDLKETLYKLGYDLEPIDSTHFAVNGTPNESDDEDVQTIMESLLDSFRSNLFLYKADKNKNIALSLSKQKKRFFRPFNEEVEIIDFLSQLMSSKVPHTSPSGKKIIQQLSITDIEHFFQ